MILTIPLPPKRWKGDGGRIWTLTNEGCAKQIGGFSVTQGCRAGNIFNYWIVLPTGSNASLQVEHFETWHHFNFFYIAQDDNNVYGHFYGPVLLFS